MDIKGKYRLPEGRERLLAHDVRHLAVCTICKGIVDDREAVSYKAAYGYPATDQNACWHPKCCFEYFGREFVLGLPETERMKFRLCDVPKDVVKALVDLL